MGDGMNVIMSAFRKVNDIFGSCNLTGQVCFTLIFAEDSKNPKKSTQKDENLSFCPKLKQSISREVMKMFHFFRNELLAFYKICQEKSSFLKLGSSKMKNYHQN